MKLLYALFTGLVFGLGIAVSGMMDPAKVLNFFDIAGTWDPSLAFVMGGALLVTFFGYRLVWRRASPLFEGAFQVPTSTVIDRKLVGGSALFGIGWASQAFARAPQSRLLGLAAGKWHFSSPPSQSALSCAAFSPQFNPPRLRPDLSEGESNELPC